MLAVLLFLQSAFDDGVQALVEALASGDTFMIVAAGVVIAAVVIVKALGKQIPFLDPILSAVLKALKSMRAKQAQAETDAAEADAERAGQEAGDARHAGGMAEVVSIEDARDMGGSFGKASPEQVAKFEADMKAAGYAKQPDGSWKR